MAGARQAGPAPLRRPRARPRATPRDLLGGGSLNSGHPDGDDVILQRDDQCPRGPEGVGQLDCGSLKHRLHRLTLHGRGRI